MSSTQGIANIIIVPAGNAAAFQAALDNANPGDTIKLSGGNYLGSFYTKKPGTAAAPIWIIGTNNSILRDAPNDPCLNIFHDYYRIENLTLQNGRRAIYAERASHGIVRNCVGKNSYKGTFKLQQQSQYWLFENCRAEGPQSLGPGEGFYVSKAKSDWETSGSTLIPDNSGYVTFLNCTAFDCIDDGFDMKESAHHIKIINCTVDFNHDTTTGEDAKTGIFSRANNLQVINFVVKNNPQNRLPLKEAYGMYANTLKVNSITYGSGMELYKFSADNIYEPMFFFEATPTNGVTLYNNYSMTNVSQGMYEPGSVQPIPADPATFKEITWAGEGGDAYANLTTGITAPPESGTPKTFSLDQNYPNPFNPATTFSFSIPSTSFVSLKVFDVLGREVTTLVSAIMSAGSHVVTWNAGALPSGIYVYQMWAGTSMETKKCMLIK
ncbi:MAG: T9SS type A sorting domain-containing protein [Ignavibacteriales bacterium]|nr:T9SS type A sorting domain-containing protein [Ignavibacteriales bacterium]